MISPLVATQLRQRGYDIESCQEAGRSSLRIPDDDQLSYAAQHGRAMLTNNSRDFLRLDPAWKAAGRRHAGIILVSRQIELGHLLRCLVRHLDTVPPSVQDDTLLWLDTSPMP